MSEPHAQLDLGSLGVSGEELDRPGRKRLHAELEPQSEFFDDGLASSVQAAGLVEMAESRLELGEDDDDFGLDRAVAPGLDEQLTTALDRLGDWRRSPGK